MKRFLMSVALSAMFLTSLNTTKAAEKGNSRPERSSAYHERHGKPFSGGYYYAGREHNHWTSCYFDKRHGCYAYLCPSTKAYYYWCKPDDCFYPVSYCPHGTRDFGAGRVCSTCPVKQPTNPPKWGGNPPRGKGGESGIWGGNPPRPTDPPTRRSGAATRRAPPTRQSGAATRRAGGMAQWFRRAAPSRRGLAAVPTTWATSGRSRSSPARSRLARSRRPSPARPAATRRASPRASLTPAARDTASSQQSRRPKAAGPLEESRRLFQGACPHSGRATGIRALKC
jgi:hypothetical protein